MSPTLRGNAHVNAVIMALARPQHGAVGRSQLVEAGVALHRIEYRIACGAITRLHRAVYGVAGLEGRRQREFAALLAIGDESFVSHRAAAAVHGMVGQLPDDVPVDITTRRDVRLPDPGIRIHRTSRLDPDEVMVREALPITAPARTLLELGAVIDESELERAVAFALRTGLVDRERLSVVMARHPRHTGRGRLRAVLAVEGGPAFTRSKGERRLLRLTRSSGLPAPETNVFVEGFEVDCLWRRERLIVEVDGRAFHSGDPAFERDRDRDGAHLAAGFRTMRITWRQLVEEPNQVIRRISQALVR